MAPFRGLVRHEQALSGDIHELLKAWEEFNSGETWREISATASDQARAAAAQFLQTSYRKLQRLRR